MATKRSSRDSYNSYMRDYMRTYRKGAPKTSRNPCKLTAATLNALADKAQPKYRDLSAVILGDPPIGRSALDQKLQAADA